MTFWTNRYSIGNCQSFYKRKWIYLTIFNFAMFVRNVTVLFHVKKENYTELPLLTYLGSFTRYLGDPIFHDCIALSFSASLVLMCFFCMFLPRKDFSWIKIFAFLNKDNLISNFWNQFILKIKFGFIFQVHQMI